MLDPTPKPDAPIGIFDSGVGGLSILQKIRAELPHEHLLYVADSAHVPYGAKSREYVERRAHTIARFLLSRGAKALVVACNTATAAAIASLRRAYDLPIIGVEPGVKPAVQQTRSGVLGILATAGTLGSEKFASLMEQYQRDVRILLQPCPGLVEQIEQGDLQSPATRTLVARFVEPLLRQGADTLVLGCTHYPFIASLVREISGTGVSLIDTGFAVARHLRGRLEAAQLLSARPVHGSESFWTSGPLAAGQTAMTQLLGRPVEVQALPPTTAYGPIDDAAAREPTDGQVG